MASNSNGKSEVSNLKQKQMLQIVSSSFYKELMRYGVDKSGIVSVSMNLLDFITEKKEVNGNSKEIDVSLYFDYSTRNVINNWDVNGSLAIGDLSIGTLQEKEIATVMEWLHEEQVENMLLRHFPEQKSALIGDIISNDARLYFSIFYKGEHIGLIGADSIDSKAHKIEMKKLIGNSNYRGRGLGKKATFLFLFYAFEIMKMNKVYIHSQDTNIKNININSRFGFQLEGILYDEVFVDEEYHDILRMSLLKNRWQKLFDK